MLKQTTKQPAALCIIRLLLVATTSFLVVLLLSIQAFAVDAGMTLSPLRSEITIAPGTTQKQTLRVANSTNTNMTVQLSSEEFSVINPDYEYSFNSGSDVLDWIRFSQTSIELSPGETESIVYDVAVPIGTEPGGKYISIFASTDSEKDQGAITSRQRIGLLLYITVDGDVTRKGSLLSLSSPLLVGDDGQWSATINNAGTAHYRSRYDVTVRHLFGNGVAAASQGEALILPGTIRRVTDNLIVPAFPGIYRVGYSIGLGDQAAYKDTRFVIYIPLWLWWTAGIAILIAAILFYTRRRNI